MRPWCTSRASLKQRRDTLHSLISISPASLITVPVVLVAPASFLEIHLGSIHV